MIFFTQRTEIRAGFEITSVKMKGDKLRSEKGRN